MTDEEYTKLRRAHDRAMQVSPRIVYAHVPRSIADLMDTVGEVLDNQDHEEDEEQENWELRAHNAEALVAQIKGTIEANT